MRALEERIKRHHPRQREMSAGYARTVIRKLGNRLMHRGQAVAAPLVKTVPATRNEHAARSGRSRQKTEHTIPA